MESLKKGWVETAKLREIVGLGRQLLRKTEPAVLKRVECDGFKKLLTNASRFAGRMEAIAAQRRSKQAWRLTEEKAEAERAVEAGGGRCAG